MNELETPVTLYVSTNGVSGLETYINKLTKQNINAKSLSTWARKLLDKSVEVAKNADQEKEYIFGTAYINAVLQFCQTEEFKTDTEYYNALPIMQNFTFIKSHIEELKKTLSDRYYWFNHTIKAVEKRTKEHEAAQRTLKLPNRTDDTLDDVLDDTLINKVFLKPKKLVSLLQSYDEDLKAAGGILLLDIRPQEEFNRNRIQFPPEWHVPSVVHIPIENAIPGVIGPELVNNSVLKTDYHDRHRFRLGKYHCMLYHIIGFYVFSRDYVLELFDL